MSWFAVRHWLTWDGGSCSGSVIDPTRNTTPPMHADARWSSARWYSLELDESPTLTP